MLYIDLECEGVVFLQGRDRSLFFKWIVKSLLEKGKR